MLYIYNNFYTNILIQFLIIIISKNILSYNEEIYLYLIYILLLFMLWINSNNNIYYNTLKNSYTLIEYYEVLYYIKIVYISKIKKSINIKKKKQIIKYILKIIYQFNIFKKIIIKKKKLIDYLNILKYWETSFNNDSKINYKLAWNLV